MKWTCSLKWFALVLCLALVNGEWKPVLKTPEQIHLSFGSQLNEFVITWLTFDATGTPVVWFGKERLDNEVQGTTTHFTDQGKLKSVRYMHRVTLSGLQYDTRYYYRVGSNDSWSAVFQFKTMPENDKWSPNILLFGDLGNGNSRTLAMMTEEIQSDKLDFAIHLGDFAYNLEHSDGRVGDAFFQEIQGMASYRPYQVLVGNHEDAFNFTAYDNRFSMYSQGSSVMNNMFYSYNWGKAHFVFFSTEFHYTPWYGTHQIMTQHRWLEEDLKKANQPDVRKQFPWIITLAHRPLYDEFYIDNLLRVGKPSAPGFESLFWKYGVDLTIHAHDHIYERLWPIYNKKIYNGTNDGYTNPGAPVHITSGSAGCPSETGQLNKYQPYYVNRRSNDYTYSRLKIYNATHLRLQTHSFNKNGTIDEFYIIKDKHGPYEAS